MASITYGVAEEKYECGKENRVSYGIVAYADSDRDGTASIVASARDISADKQVVELLAEKCNRMEVSLVHFFDVIEDFMGES